MTARDVFQIVGMGLTLPGQKGPALLGSADCAIVLSVSTPEGVPVSGLEDASFSILALVRLHGATTTVRVARGAIEEPVPGIYVVRLDRGAVDRLGSARIPCVVSIHDGKAGGNVLGRALVQVTAA